MKRNIICTVCPRGCLMEAVSGASITVTGNTCPRGEQYAVAECTNPVRTITSTMKCSDGSVISVKTDRTIPKDKMTECMEIINQNTVKLPISIGDVIIKDVFGSNIVATQNRSTNE